MILSYESLIDKWIVDNNYQKLHLLSKKLKGDDTSFIKDNAEKWLNDAAKIDNLLIFICILNSLNPEEADGIELTEGDNKFQEAITCYKNSNLEELIKLCNLSTPQNFTLL